MRSRASRRRDALDLSTAATEDREMVG